MCKAETQRRDFKPTIICTPICDHIYISHSHWILIGKLFQSVGVGANGLKQVDLISSRLRVVVCRFLHLERHVLPPKYVHNIENTRTKKMCTHWIRCIVRL